MYNRTMRNTFDFLFARPSFIEGFARVLDFGDTLTEFNQSVTGEQADLIALTMDWQALGFDLRDVMAGFSVPLKDHTVDVSQGSAASAAR